MIYLLAAFDLDGTLVHTSPEFRYLVTNRVLGEFGKSASEQEIDTFWFEHGRSEFVRTYFGVDPNNFWKVFTRHNTADLRMQYAKPYDDVGVLQELRAAGLKLAVLTGSPKHISDAELGLIDVPFDLVINATIYEDIKPKPNSEGLEFCLSQLGVNRDEAFFAGNAPEDVVTAQNACVLDVMLDRREYEFHNVNPTIRVYDLHEMKQVLGI